jgi:hypothetical protein
VPAVRHQAGPVADQLAHRLGVERVQPLAVGQQPDQGRVVATRLGVQRHLADEFGLDLEQAGEVRVQEAQVVEQVQAADQD